MCQQWLSIFGLGADVIGFLIIAVEWQRTFSHGVYIRDRELNDAFDRKLAREQGEEEPYGLAGEEEEMATTFSKLHHREAQFRSGLFWTGTGLVVVGFVLQAIGGWPGTEPIFGLPSCT